MHVFFLCRNGVVRYESVMRLRMKLDELRKMKGVTTAVKGVSSYFKCWLKCSVTNYFSTDPKEFLTVLFKHTLQAEPFIRIKCVLTTCMYVHA